METIIEIAINLFVFYLQDDVAAKFRKMLMIERYHNPELNELFENLFMDGTGILQYLRSRGTLTMGRKVWYKRMRIYIVGGVLLFLAVYLIVQGIRCSIAMKESKEAVSKFIGEQ